MGTRLLSEISLNGMYGSDSIYNARSKACLIPQNLITDLDPNYYVQNFCTFVKYRNRMDLGSIQVILSTYFPFSHMQEHTREISIKPLANNNRSEENFLVRFLISSSLGHCNIITCDKISHTCNHPRICFFKPKMCYTGHI